MYNVAVIINQFSRNGKWDFYAWSIILIELLGNATFNKFSQYIDIDLLNNCGRILCRHAPNPNAFIKWDANCWQLLLKWVCIVHGNPYHTIPLCDRPLYLNFQYYYQPFSLSLFRFEGEPKQLNPIVLKIFNSFGVTCRGTLANVQAIGKYKIVVFFFVFLSWKFCLQFNVNVNVTCLRLMYVLCRFGFVGKKTHWNIRTFGLPRKKNITKLDTIYGTSTACHLSHLHSVVSFLCGSVTITHNFNFRRQENYWSKVFERKFSFFNQTGTFFRSKFVLHIPN